VLISTNAGVKECVPVVPETSFLGIRNIRWFLEWQMSGLWSCNLDVIYGFYSGLKSTVVSLQCHELEMLSEQAEFRRKLSRFMWNWKMQHLKTFRIVVAIWGFWPFWVCV